MRSEGELHDKKAVDRHHQAAGRQQGTVHEDGREVHEAAGVAEDVSDGDGHGERDRCH